LLLYNKIIILFKIVGESMVVFRTIVILFLASSLFILSSFGPVRNPLSKVENYTIYYGEVDQDILDELSNYQLVIMEPLQLTKDQAQFLRNKGTIVLGYISLMELEKWNKPFVEKVIEEDYYLRNNEKIYIETWDTYIMDISKDHYQSLLMDEIKEEIIGKELDGVFFDTIGDIDDYFHEEPQAQKRLRAGYIKLIEEIQSANPDLLLVQNWGFETYQTSSFPYVDGLLWEDFKESKLTNSKWGQKWISYFKKQEKLRRLAVFTVAPSKLDMKYSMDHGFTSYPNEDNHYSDLEKYSENYHD
jgi:polysaccharide biosynthesis protein PelA